MRSLFGKLAVLALLVSMIPQTSYSTTDSKEIYKGTDITPMAREFQKFLRPLNRSVTIYHWAPKGLYPHFWTDLTSNGESLDQFVKFSSGRFWRNYGDETNLALGQGFYASIDPSMSYEHGGARWGYNNVWLLLEIELPVGFKVFDSRADYSKESNGPAYEEIADPSVVEIAQKFECEVPFTISSAVVASAAHQTKKCRKLFKYILKEVLKIDGIAYTFGSALKSGCVEHAKDPAFVITSERWTNNGSVKAFTRRTRTMRADRLRILSILANEKGQKTIGETTEIYYQEQPTLWKDLIGEKTIDTTDWVRKHRFGCDGTQPF